MEKKYIAILILVALLGAGWFFSKFTIIRNVEVEILDDIIYEEQALEIKESFRVSPEEKKRMEEYEKRREFLSDPANNPIYTYKSKHLPIAFNYSKYDPILDLEIIPEEKKNSDGTVSIAMDYHTIIIGQKNPNQTIQEFLKSELEGEHPERCRAFYEESWYNPNGLTAHFIYDSSFVTDDDPMGYIGIQRDCGDVARTAWYFDQRDGLKDYYFKYTIPGDVAGIVLTNSGEKVIWHETVSLVK